MKMLLKNIGIIVLGIIIGMIVNMTLIIIGEIIFVPTNHFDPMNAINWDFKYFIFPLLAHSIGTFSGSFIVSRLSSSIAMSLIVGIYFLAGGIYMVTILPAPMWFVILDISVCYIPMALLGCKINK